MNFRIIPGMSCWNSMPKKYKKAYFKSLLKPLPKPLPKPLSLYEENQKELEKIWLREIKKEKLEEKEWINWME